MVFRLLRISAGMIDNLKTRNITLIPATFRNTKMFKVHLTPKIFFGRDETLQHLHKEFDNVIRIWYFQGV